MSYQDFLKSTESAAERGHSASPSTSPAQIIHRKPMANYSPIPFTTSTGSVHKTVTQFNNLRSASISSQGPPLAPVLITKRSFSPGGFASHITATKPNIEPVSTSSPTPAPKAALTQPTTPVSTTASTPIQNGISEYPPPPAHAEWHSALKACLALQNDATSHHRKRPFAALLIGPDKTTTLLSHFSISHVRHAESELARLASLHYPIDYLRRCTLVSTWEPCAMCAGTIYWAGIGRVVYAASESKLRELTGSGNSENMTMDLPCRTIFDAGQTKVEVVGPVPGWAEKVVEESGKWWREHKAQAAAVPDGPAASGNTSVKSSSARSYNVITNPPPDEGVLSRIGEDGEYKADLKVDWMAGTF